MKYKRIKNIYWGLVFAIILLTLNCLGGCATKANLGDISKLSFKPTRKIVSSEETVNINADRVFKIVSSIQELNQSNPFMFRVSHLKSRDNEDHAIFTENFTRQFIFGNKAQTHWYTVAYDETKRIYSALLMDEGIVYGRYKVEVIDMGGTASKIKNSIMYTALNEKGVALLEKTPDSKILELLKIMNSSAKYYADNGKPLAREKTRSGQPGALKAFTSKFYQTSATGKVIGSADESFHMAGGIEELCWVPRWNFNLLYSDKKNGRTGNNTVFEESGYARYMYLRTDLPVYWHVVSYDKDNHEFQIAMNFSGELLSRIALKFKDAEGDNTIWNAEFTYASLSERGNELMAQRGGLYLDFPEKIKISPKGLIKYAQYHKKTGKIYEQSPWWLFKVGTSAIWGTLFR